MSSLNLQSLLVFAVCAQLLAPGFAGVMYPYGAAVNDTSMSGHFNYVPIAPPIKAVGGLANFVVVSI